MNACEKIMVSHRPEWTKFEWTDGEYVRQIRAERHQYACDEAPYYVESVHPLYRKDRPMFYVPHCYFVWSLPQALRRAYMERKRGWKATIYDNMTDEPIDCQLSTVKSQLQNAYGKGLLNDSAAPALSGRAC